MTLPGPQTLTLLFAAAALLGVLLIADTTRRAKRRKAAASSRTEENALLDKIDERLAGLANRIEANQATMLNRLHDDIRGLQSDMDWLAGERMIEEAVAMAHAGQQATEISSELGLTMDAAETISRFRKH